MLNDVTAFAPATVANVGIGFDILGPYRRGRRRPGAAAQRIEEPVVRIATHHAASRGDLPADAEHNTAGRAVQAHACRA